MFSEEGVHISKDDPIFHHLLLSNELIELQIERIQTLTDSIVGKNLGHMEALLESNQSKLQELIDNSKQNSEEFLMALEKTFSAYPTKAEIEKSQNTPPSPLPLLKISVVFTIFWAAHALLLYWFLK
jgi:hypothetical protein